MFEIVCVILSAILAYEFGRYQHITEYKEILKDKIFDTLLYIDLPSAYSEFINNPQSTDLYNNFCSELKQLAKKFSILQVKNKQKYKEIKNIVLKLDELAGFNTSQIVNGVMVPVEITEPAQFEQRKKDIDSLIKKLYRIIGTESYRNVLYSGKIKLLKAAIFDFLFNRY